jgi:hypothetical protein
VVERTIKRLSGKTETVVVTRETYLGFVGYNDEGKMVVAYADGKEAEIEEVD